MRTIDILFRRRNKTPLLVKLTHARALILACLLLPSPPVFAADLDVGFIGSLTGAGAGTAQDSLDGFKLGIKHLGGRLGGLELGLTVLDDHQNAAIAKRDAERLIAEEHSRVILLSSSPPISSALAPVAVSAKVFLISLDAPSDNLAGKDCNRSFFSLSGLAATMHELAGQQVQAQGYKTVGVVGPDTAASREARSAFRGGFKGRVAVVTSRRGEMNFSETLRHIRQVRPDAIYLLHTGGMAVNFLRQFDESGLKKTIPLFGPATTLDQTTLAAAGTAALGAFSVGPWSDDLDVPANRRMVGDFESEYGRLPSLHAAEGYDAAMLLDAALKAVDRKFGDYDALLNALRRADFPSTRGTVRFDTDQFPIQSYYVRQAVEDARERMVNEQRGLLVKDVRDGRSGECAMRWTAETPAKPQGGGR